MATLLGEAFVEIRPELTKFAGELKEGVTGAVGKVEGESSGAFNRLAGVGKAAFLGIAAAAVGFGAAAIDAALKGQESTAQLANAVKQAGDNWEELEPRIDKTTASYAKFGYENDVVEGALARLVQITGSTTQSLDLLQVAANLAAARHIDLTSAANLVGRAAEGNVSPLKRMGIQVVATGDAAKDGQAAIALLNERFGGAAQAQADTYAGKLKAFRAETENLTEKVGNALLPVLADLAGDAAGVVTFFENNRAAAVALGVVVGGPLVASMVAFIVQEGIMIGGKIVDFFVSAGSAAVKFAGAIASTATGVYAALGPFGLLAAGAAALAIILGHTDDAAKHAGATFADQFIAGARASANETAILTRQIGDLAQEQQQLILTETKHIDANHQVNLGLIDQAKAYLNAGAAGKDLETQYQHNREQIKHYQGELKKLNDEHKANKEVQDAARSAGVQLADTQDVQGVSASDLATKYHLQDDTIAKLAATMKIDLAKATADQIAQLETQASRLTTTSARTLALQDSLTKLADQTVDATGKATAFKTALDILIGGNIDAEKAVVNFQDKVDGLSKKLQDGKLSMDAHTDAGRKNITMVEDAVGAIRNHVEALQNQGASADALRAAFDGDTQALRDQLTQAGYTKAQVDNLISSYGLVPKNIETVIQADLAPAERALRQYAQDLAALGNAAASIKPGQQPVPVPRFAGGAYLPGNNPFLAVVNDAREVILPLDDPKRMAEILSQAGLGRGGSSSPVVAGGPAVHVGAGAVTQTFVVGDNVSGDTVRQVKVAAKEAAVEALEAVLDAHTALSPTAVPS